MLIYGVDHFTYQDVISIINGKQKANLDKKSKTQIRILTKMYKIVKSDKTVYGINTGFGPLCDVKISEEETAQLQENLSFRIL
jgi:histidine ammonia-lyase